LSGEDKVVMPPRRRQRPRQSHALIAFGRQLRRMREAKGIKQETIAHLTNISPGHASRIESGQKRATRQFVDFVDDHLDAGGALINLWEDLNKDGQPVPIWFDWPEIESDAVELVTWQPTIVPGLLQKEHYASAFLDSKDELETRMMRQGILTCTDRPPVEFTALLGEQVLENQVGSPEQMREQLEHLLAVGELPNVTIQIVRFNGRPVAQGGAFVLATMKDRSEVAYLDTTIRGITTDDESDLARLAVKLRQLRAKAMPEEMSLEMVRKALERWT
jgi:transcriptional regulator with XRE-family HTH domain